MKILTCIRFSCSLYYPRGELKATRQVILLVIEFLLFRIKKDQNKTKRLQESIR